MLDRRLIYRNQRLEKLINHMLHEYRDGRTCNMVCMNIRIKNSVEILVWYLNTVTYHQQFCLKYMIDYEFIMCKTYHGSH